MVELDSDNARKSSPWLWVLLLLTLGLTAWVSMEDNQEGDAIALVDDRVSTKQTAPRKTMINPGKRQAVNLSDTDTNQAGRQTGGQGAGLVDWQQLDRSAMAQPKNLFKSQSWAPKVRRASPKPKKVVKAAPPPAPKAPPIPFSYMGRLDNGPSGNLVYLATGDQSYSAVIGRNVNSFWRLDKEDAKTLYFTYLPLNLPQTLSKTQGASVNAPVTKTGLGNVF